MQDNAPSVHEDEAVRSFNIAFTHFLASSLSIAEM
jgi:hypothetical protein